MPDCAVQRRAALPPKLCRRNTLVKRRQGLLVVTPNEVKGPSAVAEILRYAQNHHGPAEAI